MSSWSSSTPHHSAGGPALASLSLNPGGNWNCCQYPMRHHRENRFPPLFFSSDASPSAAPLSLRFLLFFLASRTISRAPGTNKGVSIIWWRIQSRSTTRRDALARLAHRVTNTGDSRLESHPPTNCSTRSASLCVCVAIFRPVPGALVLASLRGRPRGRLTLPSLFRPTDCAGVLGDAILSFPSFTLGALGSDPVFSPATSPAASPTVASPAAASPETG
mmetsp:Transcript_12435/g.19758  ORF Transcript_12435/g.19758 Transcript_12435/m.19758 type:complete len:219 (-) Transcript_12435:2886-3542(-)